MSAPLTYWAAGPGDYRIQSKVGAISKMLRERRDTRRAAWSVAGDHLVVFAISGSKAEVQKLIRSLERKMKTISTESGNQPEAARAVLLS